MKCFYHPQIDAVGICKNCNKGLCINCGVDVGDGLACKGNCEFKVKVLNEIINKSKSVYINTSEAYFQNATLYTLLGIVFLFWSIIEKVIILKYFLLSMGLIFIIGGIWDSRLAKKFKRNLKM